MTGLWSGYSDGWFFVLFFFFVFFFNRGYPLLNQSNTNQLNSTQHNTNQIKSNQIKSNQMLVFEERGKPEYPEKNLSEQSREPTNSDGW